MSLYTNDTNLTICIFRNAITNQTSHLTESHCRTLMPIK